MPDAIGGHGPPSDQRGLGIDVATGHVHCVEITSSGTVARSEVITTDHLTDLVAWASEIGVVAIDAPARPSNAPHGDDLSITPKFRVARCAEIALGRERRIWVPWVTPMAPPFPTWMETGFELQRVLVGAADLLEVFPQAIFRVLAGRVVPSKSTPSGLASRVGLLRDAGIRDAGLVMWGHDGLDAAAAALVALHHAQRRAEAVTCGHDGSAIWLPERQNAGVMV